MLTREGIRLVQRIQRVSCKAEYFISRSDQICNCEESGFPLQTTSSTKVCIEKMNEEGIPSSQFFQNVHHHTALHLCQWISCLPPPAVYFPGKALNPEYCLGFPKDFFLGFSDSGWMETYHFYAWVTNHFAKQIPPKRPVLLLQIVGHVSHIDYDTTLFCKGNCILLFRLPPHTSHVMQPADRGFLMCSKRNGNNLAQDLRLQTLA